MRIQGPAGPHAESQCNGVAMGTWTSAAIPSATPKHQGCGWGPHPLPSLDLASRNIFQMGSNMGAGGRGIPEMGHG